MLSPEEAARRIRKAADENDQFEVTQFGHDLLNLCRAIESKRKAGPDAQNWNDKVIIRKLRRLVNIHGPEILKANLSPEFLAVIEKHRDQILRDDDAE